MHQRAKVVGRIEVSVFRQIDFLEIAELLRYNVVPKDLDKFISVDVVMHVGVSQSVNQFVYDCTDHETTWVKGHILPASNHSKPGIATSLTRPNENMILLRRAFNVADARIISNLCHSFFQHSFLAVSFSWKFKYLRIYHSLLLLNLL